MGDVIAIIIVPPGQGIVYGMPPIVVASLVTVIFPITTRDLNNPETLQERGEEKSSDRAPPRVRLNPVLI